MGKEHFTWLFAQLSDKELGSRQIFKRKPLSDGRRKSLKGIEQNTVTLRGSIKSYLTSSISDPDPDNEKTDSSTYF